MNKKGMKVTITLLIVAMLATWAAPVMAKSEKISVVFGTTNVVTHEEDAEKVTNPNGIVHVRGALRTADATLKIGDGPVLTGSVSVDLDYIKYPDMTTIMRYRKMTLTFPAQHGMLQEGTFEGTLTWKADLKDYSNTFDSHAILQGSGGFEGYTLHLDKEPGEPPNQWVLIR